jgi:hypothetical protein
VKTFCLPSSPRAPLAALLALVVCHRLAQAEPAEEHHRCQQDDDRDVVALGDDLVEVRVAHGPRQEPGAEREERHDEDRAAEELRKYSTAAEQNAARK